MTNNKILNILFILFYNVFKNLKRKLMLNMTSSDKISETLFPTVNAIIADLALRAFASIHLPNCILLHWVISLSVRPVDQQRRELAVRLYSKWYCATSGVDVLARNFRLALNRYIVCERA